MGLLYIQDAKCSQTFGGKTRRLSASFREVLSAQLSPKLERKVRGEKNAKGMYEKICLSAEKYSEYEVYRNGISSLPFRIETRDCGVWVGDCCVIWKSLPGKGIYTPWDELSAEDIECGVLIDRKNTEALNRALQFEDKSNLYPLAGEMKFPVFGRTVVGLNQLYIEVLEKVSPALLLEMAYICETFARSHQGMLATEGWPRQKGEFEMSLRIFLAKGQKRVFEGFLQALCNASFPIKAVYCNKRAIN